MYIRKINTAIVCPTKTGTHTFEKIITENYLEDDQTLFIKQFTHPTASRIKKIVHSKYGKSISNKCKFVAHIREPIDRYVSALNHRFGEDNISLDKAIDKSFITIADIVFIPQIYWLDCMYLKQELFLSQINLLRHIGFKGEVPHLNKSVPKFSIGQIKNHKYYPLIKEKYKLYYRLYKRATLQINNNMICSQKKVSV